MVSAFLCKSCLVYRFVYRNPSEAFHVDLPGTLGTSRRAPGSTLMLTLTMKKVHSRKDNSFFPLERKPSSIQKRKGKMHRASGAIQNRIFLKMADTSKKKPEVCIDAHFMLEIPFT
jgi:hypothetical protein